MNEIISGSVRAVVSFVCDVEVTINDHDVVERTTGPGGDEWRSVFYQTIRTERDVIEHLAYNCLINREMNVTRLDGWGDLVENAASMRLDCRSVQVTEVRSWTRVRS